MDYLGQILYSIAIVALYTAFLQHLTINNQFPITSRIDYETLFNSINNALVSSSSRAGRARSGNQLVAK